MQRYEQIFENNLAWVARCTASDPDYFSKLAREQHPAFFYIGCADSRVPANEIMGLEPGDVFVHRNVANLVVNTDYNVHACLQFAVEQLHVRHVIVCGHYGCGGIRAAMQPNDLGLLNGWLREVQDVYRLHADELDAIADETERYARLVELNVREQAFNVVKTAWVQHSLRERGYPTVHGCCYDLRNGILRDLEISFDELLAETARIYPVE